MRLIFSVFAACLFFYAQPLFAIDAPLNSERAAIDLLMARAISQNLIAGGIAVIGNRNGILSITAKGRLNASEDSPLINEHTLFDVASLTKVIATAPAVMKLLEEGRITLTDPLTRWFPEFKNSGRDGITILNLLTHTSGLQDIMLHSGDTIRTTIQKIAGQKYRGNSFRYADINFILLGELVNRVSGKTLDAFCHDQLYAPLGAQETMFLPPHTLSDMIAPTTGINKGIVQDLNARRLGGVAGHAGLFSSASDLAKFARLIMGGGMIDGNRILSEQIVTQMTAPYFCGSGTVRRGLGWDINSPFSAPRGNFFSETSFGHTGYSGSSIWIDPQRDLFVILLTVRLNYRDTGLFNQLRRDVSTVAATEFKNLDEYQGLPLLAGAARASSDLIRIETSNLVKHTPSRATKQIAQFNKKKHHLKYAQQRFNKKDKRMAKNTGTNRTSGRVRS